MPKGFKGFQKENKEWKKQSFNQEWKDKISLSKMNEKNPQWKGGISQDFYRKFLKKNCEICNKEAKIIHHLDKDRQNNKKENLQSLCYSCHLFIHKPNKKKI